MSLQNIYSKSKDKFKNTLSLFGLFSKTKNAPIIGYRKHLTSSIKGRALISYITAPFQSENPSKLTGHQNKWEAVEIARIFNKLGYVVDVAVYNDDKFNSKKNYDLIFGQGNSFARHIESAGPSCLKIYYATGAHWSFQNPAEQSRIDYLQQRKGVKLNRKVFAPPNRSAEKADGVICIGNEFTVSTYLPYNTNVKQLNQSGFDFLKWPEDKNFDSAVHKFFWLGSRGMVHKGLDLVLEVFKNLPNLELYIGGKVLREKDFAATYHNELLETPNINLLGYIDIQSETFEDVTNKCGYIIFPSCSEATAGSVITTMHRGLVPIVTRETGVDTKDFGITLCDATIETIREAVIKASKQPAHILKDCSKKSFQEAKKNYTRNKFSENFEKVLRQFLDEHTKAGF